MRWHLSALLALPLLAFCWRQQRVEARQLAVLGIAWIVAVVLPFSLAQQKSEWHLNLLIPGAAWLLGATLASLPRPALRLAPAVLIGVSAGWGLLELRGTPAANQRQRAIEVLTTTPAALAGAKVANCSPLTPWVSTHLFAFHWNALPIACEAPAAWRFDGVSLQRTFQK